MHGFPIISFDRTKVQGGTEFTVLFSIFSLNFWQGYRYCSFEFNCRKWKHFGVKLTEKFSPQLYPLELFRLNGRAAPSVAQCKGYRFDEFRPDSEFLHVNFHFCKET